MTRFWTTLLPVLLLTVPISHQALTRQEKTAQENQESFDATTIVVPFNDEIPTESVDFESDFKKIGSSVTENIKDKSTFGAKKTEFLIKRDEKKQASNKGKKPSPYLIELDSISTIKPPTDGISDFNEAHSVNATIEEKMPLLLNDSKDQLVTSESRQRSKIEIKEVNGTLYEYEYIYYYDDDYPMYDYDTPSITGDTNSSSAGSVTSQKKETAIPSLPSNVEVGSLSTSEHKAENELQSVADNEILSQGFAEPRHLDNIAAENNFELLQTEGGQLPAQTRFPPRSTTPPSEFTTDLPNDGRPKANMAAEKAAIDLYAFSKLEDKLFEESSTKAIDYDFTTEPPNYFDSFYEYDITAGDLEELGLLTTSDTDQAGDFITTLKDILPTEEPSTTTPSTTTTMTTTTTATTTTTTTTTTEEPSTSRTRSFGGRNRPSLPGRGFTRQRGITSNDITTHQSKEPLKSESDSSTPATSHGRRKFGRINLGDKKHFKEESKPSEDKVSLNSETETESPVKESPSLQTRGRFNRRKPPTLRNRNILNTATEAAAEKQEKQIEEATETTSKAPRQSLGSSNSRQRRPLGRNRLFNRFNPQINPSGDTDSVDKTATEQNEAVDAISEVASTNPEDAVEEPKNQSPTTTEKSLRPNVRRNHRFNINNRRNFRNRKEDRLPQAKTEDTASETAQEPAPEEKSLAGTTPQEERLPLAESKAEAEPALSPNPLNRPGFRRRNNRKNLNRLNHRFKNNQETSEGSETQNAAPITPSASDDSSPNLTTDHQVEEETSGHSPLQSDVTDQASKISRASPRDNPRKNRFQNRRRQKPTLTPSLVASTQTDAAPETHEANIEEPPVEPEVHQETTGAEQTEQSPSPDQAVEENVTEIVEPEATTEKLTRRQQLAKRRNRFLHNG